MAAVGVATTAMIYAQLIAGAIMRHTGAGLAIPWFPDLRSLLPPLDDPRVRRNMEGDEIPLRRVATTKTPSIQPWLACGVADGKDLK